MNSAYKRRYKQCFCAVAVVCGWLGCVIPAVDAQPVAPVTIADLAAAQSQKIMRELGGSAVTAVAPKTTMSAPRAAVIKEKPQAIVVLATYGTPLALRAELSVNGITRIVHPKANLGLVTVDAIEDGRVHLTVMHRGRPYAHALRPGERIEAMQ